MAEAPNKADFESGAEYAAALRAFQQQQAEAAASAAAAKQEEAARITTTYYDVVGPQVTGAQQEYLDEIYAGYGSGKYSGSDVENAMSILSGQATAGVFNNGGGGGGGDEEIPTLSQDAKATLSSVLRRFGLENLAPILWNKYANKEFDIDDEDSMLFSIKEEQAYKDRFAANAARIARGLTELTPSTYLNLERTYRETLAANGLPAGFYDAPSDFQKLIEGDVAVSELNNRLKDAYSVIRDADQTVVNKLRTEYGIGDGELLAYFIDPERARPMLSSADYKRQAQAAVFMGRAERMAGINLQKTQAEELARLGVTTAEAEKAFTTISQMNELRRANPNEMQLTDAELVAAATGTDTAAAKKLEDIKNKRKASFLGGGSYSQRQGVAGEIKTGI